jgi:hypothetical protein
MRDFCYVVRYCYILTAEPRKDREVPRRRQIRTKKTAPADFKFNTEKRVLDVDARRGLRILKMIRAGAQLEYALAVDPRQP